MYSTLGVNEILVGIDDVTFHVDKDGNRRILTDEELEAFPKLYRNYSLYQKNQFDSIKRMALHPGDPLALSEKTARFYHFIGFLSKEELDAYLKQLKGSSTWLISDPHFDHINILSYENRPFADHLEMTEELIRRYEETVAEGDTVFWLGDMFFCNATRMKEIASRLSKTRNILIRGNHDKRVTNSKFVASGFLPHKMYLYEGYMLTHEPISNHNMGHLHEMGVKGNIHGHVHSRIQGMNPATHQCVSVENTHYRPILFEEVVERFRIAQGKEASSDEFI